MSLNQAFSVVNLFYESKILPEKNFEVDSIADYLANLNKSTINDFQYIKHERNIQIKIDVSQFYLDYQSGFDIDYLSIQNYQGDVPESIIYYFVINKTWRSKNTILLDLYMDTINSFQGKYTLSDRTKVLREHKDRWKYDESLVDVIEESINYDVYESPYYYINIDFVSNFVIVDDYVLEVPYYFEEVNRVHLSFINGKWHLVGLIKISNSESPTFPMNVIVDFYYTSKLLPIIDEYSEGVSPILFKKKEEKLDNDGMKWYLAYQNPLDPDDPDKPLPAVNCFLYPSKICNIEVMTRLSYDHNNYTEKQVYLFGYDMNSNDVLINDQWKPTISYPVYDRKIYSYFIIYREQGANELEIWQVAITYTLEDNEWEKFFTLKNRVYHGDDVNLYSALSTINVYSTTANDIDDFIANLPLNPIQPNSTLTFTTFNQDVLSINEADRTLSTYLKIIELPYCPVDYTYDDSTNKITMPDFVSIESFNEGVAGYRLKVDMNEFSKASSTLSFNVENPLKFLNGVDSITPLSSDPRNDDFETKLYHSDYYRPKFVYDSFGYDFNLEQENNSLVSITANVFRCIFKSNSSASGSILFHFFEEYKKISYLDYDSILTIARSLDYPLYNSEYLNYIRTGYNYDIKNKQLNNFGSVLSGGIGVIGGLGAVAGGVATGNPIAMVSGITSISSSIATTITNIAKSELSIQQKLEEKSKQAASIIGADDLDLLNYYTNGNKAKLVWYEVSDRMKQALADLFYYCGYATEEYKVPNPNTRLWFNYIQASIIIKKTDNLSDIIIQDITSRYEAGITFLHKVSGSWDIDQTKENWEVSILNA